jgi:RNA polymerase sigma factor (sigma-70 family)
MTNEVPFAGFIVRLREGDSAAWEELWRQYAPLLEGVIRKRLTGKVGQREGSEDVLISVFRTFWRRMSEGQFDLAEDKDLRNLLYQIAVNKAFGKERHHRKKRRSVDREEGGGSGAPGAEDRLGRVADPNSLLAAVAVAEQLERLLESLEPEELMVLALRLEGMTVKEIGERINRSERYVGGRLRRVKRRLARDLEDTNS